MTPTLLFVKRTGKLSSKLTLLIPTFYNDNLGDYASTLNLCKHFLDARCQHQKIPYFDWEN